MIINCYAVYDSKACAFLAPFFAAANGLAIRMFSDAANDPSTTLHKHPSDFNLYQIGTFDDSKGILKSEVPAIDLGRASSYLEPVKGVQVIHAPASVNGSEVKEEVL